MVKAREMATKNVGDVLEIKGKKYTVVEDTKVWKIESHCDVCGADFRTVLYEGKEQMVTKLCQLCRYDRDNR